MVREQRQVAYVKAGARLKDLKIFTILEFISFYSYLDIKLAVLFFVGLLNSSCKKQNRDRFGKQVLDKNRDDRRTTRKTTERGNVKERNPAAFPNRVPTHLSLFSRPWRCGGNVLLCLCPEVVHKRLRVYV